MDRRLEAIAGPPLFQRSTTGSMTVPVIDPMKGRTLYTVINITSTTASYPSFAIWGTFGAGALTTRALGPGSTYMGARFDTLSGSNDVNSSLYDTRTIGKHTVWAQVSDGMNSAVAGVDEKVGSAVSLTPAGGMPTASMSIPSNTGSTTLFAVGYDQVHDQATRQRILAWLRQRYQVTPPPPAG